MPNISSLRILVTGGLGYIGSHAVVKLIEAGARVCVVDNLSNSQAVVVDAIKKITGKSLDFIKGDVRDCSLIETLLRNKKINAVFHFAGLKAVGESELFPLKYYENNVSGSLSLISAMKETGVKTLIFSSSATVYGDPGAVKYKESTPLKPINVYGRTKLMVEEMLVDLKKSDENWRIGILRYFNPVGAHHSGLIGERPNGIPNNLVPFIVDVARGKRPKLHVYGSDYPTPDGTGLRDYVHVDDLAEGHIAALRCLVHSAETVIVNLGTGRPVSVLEMVHTFEKVSGVKIPLELAPRRAGDLAEYYADPLLAKKILNWEAKLDLTRMCVDCWRFQGF